MTRRLALVIRQVRIIISSSSADSDEKLVQTGRRINSEDFAIVVVLAFYIHNSLPRILADEREEALNAHDSGVLDISVSMSS